MPVFILTKQQGNITKRNSKEYNSNKLFCIKTEIFIFYWVILKYVKNIPSQGKKNLNEFERV